MIGSFLLLALLVFGSTGGEILITLGMKRVGPPERLRPREVLHFLGKALRSARFWMGIPLMALSFFALLVLLSWEPISFVIPATALDYPLGALGAKYILGEKVTSARWWGAVLVCAGVALVATG